MDPLTLRPWTLVMTERDWDVMMGHHFPGDSDEHGSALVCGVVETPRERRLLVREVVLAREGVDYVPSRHAHRQLTAAFVSSTVGRCADEKLAYLAVHNHNSDDWVGFSGTDMDSHERGYPALLDITSGGPVGALVLGRRAVAGDVWERAGRGLVEKTVVLGANRRVFSPSPAPTPERASLVFERQARLFGDAGQALLGTLKVGLIGAGGAGSLIGQGLAHLGVGEVVNIDDDVIESENRPRQVGTFPSDARRIERPAFPGTPKVDVLRRLALGVAVNPELKFHAIRGNVVEPQCARELLDCDAIFLAADTMQARHVFNAVVHQYLVPGFQVGAKALIKDDRVLDAYAVARNVGAHAMCLWCSELIDPTRLGLEGLSREERAKAEYVKGVPQPSVITMNTQSTAFAMNDFLFMFTGLHEPGIELGARWYYFLRREPVVETAPVRSETCFECAARKGRGDRRDLPLMLPQGEPTPAPRTVTT